MAESPLTCEVCKAAPAEYLVVADFRPPTGRAMKVECKRCTRRERATRAWLSMDPLHIFALTPVTEGAHRG